jgi:peroxiredoxin
MGTPAPIIEAVGVRVAASTPQVVAIVGVACMCYDFHIFLITEDRPLKEVVPVQPYSEGPAMTLVTGASSNVEHASNNPLSTGDGAITRRHPQASGLPIQNVVEGLTHTPSGSRSATPHRLAPGDAITPLELTTIRSERILVPAPDVLTHLQFRRYAGCPICNLHLRSVARRHDEIVAAGVREIAVFHSSVEDMLPHQGELPFAAVADPGRALYTAFGVESSLRAVLHPRAWSAPINPGTWSVVVRGIRAGGSPAPAKGESALGLPADFLIDPDGRVRAAKYGRHASDHWSVDELLQLARTPSTG